MELKVWVEGIQRIVCGVTESTTCQDVVYALAHATGKSGRFTLIERWRNNERQLAPHENPLKILLKWGEYSNDVQFILQRSDGAKNSITSNSKTKSLSPTSPPCPSTPNSLIESSERSSLESPHKSSSHSNEKVSSSPDKINTNKPLTFSDSYISSDNIGIVKGIPHVQSSTAVENNCDSHSPKKPIYYGGEKGNSPSHRIIPHPPVPPPYRDPPPPTSAVNYDKFRKNIPQESNKLQQTRIENGKTDFSNRIDGPLISNAQYRELISLINYQREKISSLQADLNKYDAEIVYWENKEREKQCQLDYLAQEIMSMTNVSKVNNEQIQALSYVEEESEIVKQQEKTLKSEITLLRSKLANCETELLQCKNKIRLVMEEIQMEQKVQSRRNENRKHLEKSFLAEVEKLQKDVELAKQSTELHHLTAETLKKEVSALELAIKEKKKQLEHLVQEMKEANLQSLSIAPPEEIKHLFEGPSRTGSTRKMIGSPRQLENAVPTNKNPHGVWV